MKLESIEWTGKQISAPGMYSKIPMESYHNGKICVGPSCSSSDLRTLFNDSPAHCFVKWPGNPNRVAPEEKKHFVLGRAVHMLFLGEQYLAKMFAQQPPGYPEVMKGATPVQIATTLPDFMAGKMAKVKMLPWANGANFCKAWHELVAKQGRSVLTDNQITAIRGMSQALKTHPIIKAGALNGLIERSIFYKDKPTGLWIKTRPDVVAGDSADFVDLKTTTSVKWNDLVRTISDFGYHMQGGLICRSAREVLKIENPTFSLIFVETSEPYCIRVVTLKDHVLQMGEQQNRMALDTMARCIESGRWPGPGGDREDAENIELSEYATKQIEDRLKFGIST